MISFKQFLEESLNTKSSLTKVEIPNIDHDSDVYTFNINKQKYFVLIDKQYDDYQINFGIGDPLEVSSSIGMRKDAYEATNSNIDQFKVISIVTNGLVDYFTANPISKRQTISFSAKGISRIRLYETIANRIAKKFDLKVSKIGNTNTIFILKRQS